MIHRATQTSEYWSNYQFSAEDTEYVSNLLLESGSSKSTNDLALGVIQRRVDVENARIRRDIDRSSIYQPKKQFTHGEEILFPTMRFNSGRVIDKRPGITPENVQFEVIKVEFRDGTRSEFASNYDKPHRINDDSLVATLLNQQADLKSTATLFETHGTRIASIIDTALERNDNFIRIGEDWFLRAMMADVNTGHVNLAEAVLEVAGGGPLPTHIILRDLGLPQEIARSLQEASLNNVLAADPRFDEVSLTDKPAWFLRRLEPDQVREFPAQLLGKVATSADPASPLDQLMITLDDELDTSILKNLGPLAPQNSASVVLTAPHRRAGTLGLGRRLTSVFPDTNKPRIPVFLRDKLNNKQFTVWLVKDGNYIWGLGEWYKTNDLPVGATIEISRTAEPNVFIIDGKRHKPKRDWVRVASVRDQRLRLDTAQRATTCAADDLMSVYADDLRIFENVRVAQTRDVAQIVREVFPEIAKLSPQGHVHASTLYSVVNLIMRIAPRDVFNALCNNPSFITIGDNYWHLSDRN